MKPNYSRLAQVEEKKSIKSAIIFGGLTILIIILGLIFGIPTFSKFIGLFNRSSNEPITTQSNLLLVPTLSAPPQFTNQKSIIVKGTATPNTTIKIFFNDSSDQTSSDDKGNFAMNVNLQKGTNTIFARTIDKSGNQSENSTTFTVTFTDQAPSLTVSSPSDGQSFYGDKQKTISVQGQTDTNVSVTINDHVAIVDNTGKFNFSYNLNQGDNQLKIVATDLAGNKKEISLKVTFNP